MSSVKFEDILKYNVTHLSLFKNISNPYGEMEIGNQNKLKLIKDKDKDEGINKWINLDYW